MSSTRCGIYARFSSEKQNAASIVQQRRKCEEHATRNGWEVLPGCVFYDEAISGASDNRPGLQRVLEEAQRKPKPFDILLVDDTSRLSRKLSDALRTIERLEFAGIRVVFVSQGFDSSSAQAQTLVAVHGLIDGVYLEELRQKTRRGVEQLHIEGKHTGGRVFGYRHRPIEDPTRLDVHGRPAICGVKLEVNPLQASIIRRIFQEYANGRSMKAIAVGLNHSRIASPQPQKGRISQSWCQSSIRHILLNERYRGIVNWGRTKKVRDPQTGKRIYRRKPPSEWLRKEISSQRIVTDELWSAVQDRFQIVRRLYGRPGGVRGGRAAGSRYLFTGLLECSVCHGSVTIVSGVSGKRKERRYGCSYHSARGSTVCTNSLLVPQPSLERQLLAGLRSKVLHEDVMNYALLRFEQALSRTGEGLADGTPELKRREVQLEREIANVARALTDGYSFTMSTRLRGLEKELDGVRVRLAKPDQTPAQFQAQEVKRFVHVQLADLRLLLNRDVTAARAQLAKHIEKITLTPEGKTYVACGSWDLLGRGCYSGAGGQNRTGYARLFRAALYQ